MHSLCVIVKRVECFYKQFAYALYKKILYVFLALTFISFAFHCFVTERTEVKEEARPLDIYMNYENGFGFIQKPERKSLDG